MRADYATSDLISRVNSDWIKEVLANPEFGGADPGDDVPGDDVVSDLMLQPGSSRKQAIPMWREPLRPSANLTRADQPEPGVTVARPSRRRSVARRVTERLALAVAALVAIWVGVRMAPQPRDVTGAVSGRATDASPEPAAPINATALRPAWLLPEILYGPAMARSPVSGPKSGR